MSKPTCTRCDRKTYLLDDAGLCVFCAGGEESDYQSMRDYIVSAETQEKSEEEER